MPAGSQMPRHVEPVRMTQDLDAVLRQTHEPDPSARWLGRCTPPDPHARSFPGAWERIRVDSLRVTQDPGARRKGHRPGTSRPCAWCKASARALRGRASRSSRARPAATARPRLVPLSTPRSRPPIRSRMPRADQRWIDRGSRCGSPPPRALPSAVVSPPLLRGRIRPAMTPWSCPRAPGRPGRAATPTSTGPRPPASP
jgi:hypothetical protein